MTFEKRFVLLQNRFRTAQAQPPQTQFAVQITLTGEEAGTLYIANTQQGFAVAPFDYRDHTAALTISGPELVRFLGGTLRLQRALQTGRAQAEGDLSHIELLAGIADAPQRRVRRRH